jgi:hypothetical protein
MITKDEEQYHKGKKNHYSTEELSENCGKLFP